MSKAKRDTGKPQQTQDRPQQGAPQQRESRRPGFDQYAPQGQRERPQADRSSGQQPGRSDFEHPQQDCPGVDRPGMGRDKDRLRKGAERSDRDAGAGQPVQLDEDEGTVRR